ncbi:hypothetical protein [Streptomyces tropicalis]|uniref:Uncharacterized protein n=1 Tax=Streptomyces tropicalis TaxID=3034234 RepID=A0ABT6A8S0_9ACTN|nr:hypothetical protein [Streptomyces tropicalis]MDF3301029.1 hypothetical protein [Streptomyces tropicalis]
MRNGGTITRFGTAAAAGAAAAALLSGTAVAADAVTAQPAAHAGQAAASRLTVGGYTAWLKAQRTPEATKTLKAFTALPRLRQVQFVTFLQDRGALRALAADLKGGMSGLHTVRHYNPAVSIVNDVRVTRSQGTAPSVRVSYTATEQVFGIPVTSEQVWVTYATKGGKYDRPLKSGSHAVNTNAAIRLAGRDTSHSLPAGPGAKVMVRWTATPRVSSFGAGVAQDQSILAGPLNVWKAQLRNR